MDRIFSEYNCPKENIGKFFTYLKGLKTYNFYEIIYKNLKKKQLYGIIGNRRINVLKRYNL